VGRGRCRAKVEERGRARVCVVGRKRRRNEGTEVEGARSVRGGRRGEAEGAEKDSDGCDVRGWKRKGDGRDGIRKRQGEVEQRGREGERNRERRRMR